MQKKRHFSVILIGALILFSLAANSLGAEVVFRVIMSVQEQDGEFDPSQDSLVVRGSFNNWGQSGGHPDLVCEEVNDSLWTASEVIEPGPIEYRYFIVKMNGTQISESIPPRILVVTNELAILDPVYFNDDVPNFIPPGFPGPSSPQTILLATAYPNPFSGRITIEAEVSTFSPLSVVLYDLTGRTILEYQSATPVSGLTSLSLPFDGLPVGGFLCRVRSGAKSRDLLLFHLK